MQDTNKKMYYEITAPKTFNLGLLELWQYREMLYIMVWRDIKIKYKQTILGASWVILQPLIMMIVFTLFFGKTLNISSGTIPYPVFVLSGILIWNLFSSGLSNASSAMLSNTNIIKKIYFPRLIIPFSSVSVSLFDFIVSTLLYSIVLVYYKIDISIVNFILCFLGATIITLTVTIGLGSLLSALTVKYRDFKFILPFVIQILLFISPVIYPMQLVQNDLILFIMYLNPITCAVELMHSSISGSIVHLPLLATGCCISVILLIIGVIYFRKTEIYFADIA